MRQVSLTLCCADEDEAALAGLVAALRRERLNPELIVGVDIEPRRFGQAIDEQEGAAVFAICSSYQLDPGVITRLEGLFSARRGPEHSLITVNIERGTPATWLAEIHSAMSRTREDELVEDDDDRIHLREVVGITDVRVPGAAPTARAAPSGSGTGAGSGAFDMTGSGAFNVTGSGSFRRPPAPNQPAPPGAGPSSVSSTGQHHVSPSTTTTDKPPPRGPARLPPKMPPPEVEKSEPLAASPAPAQGKGSSTLFVALVGGLAAAVAIFGLYVLSTDTPVENPLSRRAPVPAASPMPGADPRPMADEDVGTTSGDEEQGGTTGGADEVPHVDLDAPLTDVQQSERLGRALAEGRVKALGDQVFFVDERSTTWHEGANFCKASPVKGVLGFRLPSKKALRKIARAGLLENEGLYWSSTLDAREGDGTSHVFALDSATKRLQPHAKSGQALRVCVRAME